MIHQWLFGAIVESQFPKDWRFERCEMSHFYRKGKHIELIKSIKSIRKHEQIPRFFESPCWWHPRSSTRQNNYCKATGASTAKCSFRCHDPRNQVRFRQMKILFSNTSFHQMIWRERESYVILLFRIEKQYVECHKRQTRWVKLDILTAGSRFMCFTCDVFVLAWFFSKHWSNF